jgi:hypothetical protein
MAKFTFKDTGKEIKVGDVFYFYHIEYKNKPSVAIPFVAKDVEYIVKSCKVQDFDNNSYGGIGGNWGHFSFKCHFLITDDINNPTFTINDCLYSSQEACNDAMEIGKLQKSISQDIFAVHDINIIKDINNKILNNINL